MKNILTSTLARGRPVLLCVALASTGCSTTRHFEFPPAPVPDEAYPPPGAPTVSWSLGEVYVKVDPNSAAGLNVDYGQARQELARYLRDELPRRLPSARAGPAVTIDLETSVRETRPVSALFVAPLLVGLGAMAVGCAAGYGIVAAAHGDPDDQAIGAMSGDAVGGAAGIRGRREARSRRGSRRGSLHGGRGGRHRRGTEGLAGDFAHPAHRSAPLT